MPSTPVGADVGGRAPHARRPPTWFADVENYFNGAVDRVRVWQGVLTEAQITGLANEP